MKKDKSFYEALLQQYGSEPKLAKFYRSKIKILEKQEKEARREAFKNAIKVILKKDKPIAEKEDLNFNRSFLGMADDDCSICKGISAVGYSTSNRFRICDCVYRNIARASNRKWREINEFPSMRPAIAIRPNGPMVEFPQSDYLADFEIALKRVLEGFAYSAYRMHYLNGHSFSVCLPLLNEHYKSNYSQGQFHTKTQQALARMGEELVRCGLFPFGEYFRMRTVPLSVFNPKRTTKTKTIYRDPWMGGGSWEDFRDKPEYNEQFQAYHKVPVKPMDEAEKHINKPRVKRKDWISRKRFNALFTKPEFTKGPGKAKSITYDYCKQLNMVRKDYEWLDGETASTLFKLSEDGRRESVAVHVAKFDDGWRVFDKTKGKAVIAASGVSTFEEAKESGAKIVEDILDEAYTNFSSSTNIQNYKRREKKRQERLEGEKFSDN